MNLEEQILEMAQHMAAQAMEKMKEEQNPLGRERPLVTAIRREMYGEQSQRSQQY